MGENLKQLGSWRWWEGSYLQLQGQDGLVFPVVAVISIVVILPKVVSDGSLVYGEVRLNRFRLDRNARLSKVIEVESEGMKDRLKPSVQFLIPNRQGTSEEKVHDGFNLGLIEVRADVDNLLAIGQGASVKLHHQIMAHRAAKVSDTALLSYTLLGFSVFEFKELS